MGAASSDAFHVTIVLNAIRASILYSVAILFKTHQMKTRNPKGLAESPNLFPPHIVQGVELGVADDDVVVPSPAA